MKSKQSTKSRARPQPVEVALGYVGRGWSPIPIPHRKKNPGFKDWQNTRIDENTVEVHFGEGPGNIGVLLGGASGGLIDGDMDCDEAVIAANVLLPTTCRFGRTSRPDSHYLFYADGCPTTKYVDRSDGQMLVEFRGEGHQTVFPGSTHPSGESIRWSATTTPDPATVEPAMLIEMFGRVAAAALLARHWPKGTRHDASLAVAGGLLRAGWSAAGTEAFIRAVAAAARDEEASERVKSVSDTAKKLAEGDEVTGWPTLEKLLGEAVVRQAKDWLRIGGDVAASAEGAPKKQADLLVALAREHCTFFHDSVRTPYARASNGSVMQLRSGAFDLFLGSLHFKVYGRSAASTAKNEALATLKGIALHDSPHEEVAVRVAAHSGRIYLDLANERHEAVEVDTAGWRIVTSCPVNFLRPDGILELPTPTPGGDVYEILSFLNRGASANYMLILAWLLAALRPSGPFPVLVLQGRHGSAKSTTARILRALIDPNAAPVRAPPRSEQDLVIAARNGWLLAYDNLSGLSDWLSDALCRLATGSAFATRKLYSDADETIFYASRPMILNGIDDLLTRPDLADRALLVPLAEIPPSQRQAEAHMFDKLKRSLPDILGALLDGAAMALRDEATVKLTSTPRMADFVRWAAAGLPALGYSEKDLHRALERSKAEATALALEVDGLGNAIIDFLQTTGGHWSGSATELLTELRDRADAEGRRELPSAPPSLANRLRRLAPTLREVGVGVKTTRVATQRRIELVRKL